MSVKISLYGISLILLMVACTTGVQQDQAAQSGSYADLVTLYHNWRTFEQPPLLEGAPDYTTATFKKREPDFQALRNRLKALDTTGWPVAEQVDYWIVWAEMNGYEFNQRVLQPWARDPAYYKSIWMERSDVPAHEGPTHHGITEVWTYTFPINTSDKTKLMTTLKAIAPLNRQARQNLTGNAKDLWVAGIRDIRQQIADLEELSHRPGVSEDADLKALIAEASTSTQDLVTWLEGEAIHKTGPSGLGKEHYTWYLQHVHLVPLTWEDEVLLLKRELSRAWASLKLEEHHNRALPRLVAADSPPAYDSLARWAANSLMNFLVKNDVLTVKDYFAAALDEHLGAFVPADKRNFFWIATHYDPRPLYSHFYHWFELAVLDREPHPSEVRRSPLLYNIFDSHNEGIATAVEEMFMQAGLYDDHPRVREIVYIMIAQRAARGLGSLYAHANDMDMAAAGAIHTEYTPRGWMKVEKDLMQFEQHLYLRQPGYGTSYITGKYLAENALGEFGRQHELSNKPFELKSFFDQYNAMGNIPVSLVHWQMTGDKEPLLTILKNKREL